jgi:peptidoglycan/LPS O-acetylase OafA/YrhL
MEQSTQNQNLPRIQSLDALRGVAIIGVVWVHSALIIGASGRLYDIGFMGQRGVQLFYIISAFTLCYSRHMRIGTERRPLVDFYVRRFFRIAPLYYTAILLKLCYRLRPAGPSYYLTSRGLGWLNLVLGFLFLNGVKPDAVNTVAIGGWSIAAEAMFYGVFPLICRWVNNVSRAVYCFVILAILCNGISWFLFWKTNDDALKNYFTFLWFPVQLPVFCLGFVLFYCWLWDERRPAKDDSISLRYPRSGLSRRRLVAFAMIGTGILGFIAMLPMSNANMLVATLFVALFAFGVVSGQPTLFVNRVTLYLGKISYSMYLLHFFIFMEILRLLPKIDAVSPVRLRDTLAGLVFVFLTLMTVSALIATVSYKLIEEPGMRLGRRIIAALDEPPSGQPGQRAK